MVDRRLGRGLDFFLSGAKKPANPPATTPLRDKIAPDAGSPTAKETQGEVVGRDVGEFDGPVDLAHRLAESQDVADCYAEQWMRFAQRRAVDGDDECVLDTVRESFSESGHDIRKLIVAIAATEAFRRRRPAALEQEEE